MWRLALLLIWAGCVESNAVTCELGADTWTCPATALCDPARVGCVTTDQLESCVGMPDGTGCMIGGAPGGVCETAVCEQSRCGDGFVVAPEQCDGANLGAMPSCLAADFYDNVPVGCAADCTYDYSVCTGTCGDLMVNGPELCDGAPPALSCFDLGYAAGVLGCKQCGPGLDDCKLLGWTARSNMLQLRAVRGDDDFDVFAVGASSSLLHFDGSIWSDIDVSSCVTAGNTFSFEGVYPLGNNKALVVGGEGMSPMFNDAVLVTVDGTSCTRTLVAAGAKSLQDVWQFSPTNIWAVGDGFFHFDGTSWTRTQPTVLLSRMWASGPSDIYAVGSGGVWHFNGTSWGPSSTVSTYGIDVTGRSASDVYVGGDAGVEHWNGSTWSAPASAPFNVLSLAVSDTHLFAGTYQGVHVLDSGLWSTLVLPAPFTQAVDGAWMSAKGNLYVTDSDRVARYPGGVLTVTPVASANYATSIAVRDARRAYALFEIGLFAYNGYAWSADYTSSPYAYDTYSDMWRSPTDTLYFSQYKDTGAALMSWVDGVPPTWTLVASIPGGAQALWGTSDTDIWLITAFSRTLRHYSGSSQLDVECATCTPGGQYNAFWGTSPSNIFVIGFGGEILHWTGAAWSAMTSGTTKDLYAIWGDGPGNVFVAGDGVFLHYNGTSWAALPAAPGRARGRALWGRAGDDLFVSTTQGVYHYSNTRWSRVRTNLDSGVAVIGGSGVVTLMLDDTLGNVVRLVRTIDW